jgi:hypothetical protein
MVTTPRSPFKLIVGGVNRRPVNKHITSVTAKLATTPLTLIH